MNAKGVCLLACWAAFMVAKWTPAAAIDVKKQAVAVDYTAEAKEEVEQVQDEVLGSTAGQAQAKPKAFVQADPATEPVPAPSGSAPETPEQAPPAASPAHEPVESPSFRSRVTTGAGHAFNATKEWAYNVSQKMYQKYNTTREYLKEKFFNVTNGVRNAEHAAEEKLEHISDATRQAAHRISNATRNAAHNLNDDMHGNYAHEHVASTTATPAEEESAAPAATEAAAAPSASPTPA
ncbi:unnamed protein product [Amoebophrya sp. A120]|nr:unnamed protein product [Amoebophrya sp. A120]|eukprot:GSA120T00023976001.1